MEKKETKAKHRRGLWWKIPLCTVVGLIVVLVIAVSVALRILTPEKLTALVNDHASEFLDNGTISTSRVELTWWSTFPRFEIAVDSLSVRSNSEAIPDSAATLLAVERFHGAVDLAALFKGRIQIDDVTITRPAVCLYFGADSISNLDIFPSSDSEKDTVESQIAIPPLGLQRFVIEGDAPLRYISAPDSTDVAVTLRLLRVDNAEPLYAVKFSALPRTNLVSLPDSFEVALDGGVRWNAEKPMEVELVDFTAAAGEVAVTVNSLADLNTPPTLRTLKLQTNGISPAYLVGLARRQPGMASIPEINCPGPLTIGAELMQPYLLTDTLLPALNASVELADGPLAVPSMKMRFRNVGLSASASIAPSGIDQSTVTVNRLTLTGDRGATSVDISGSATDLATDPKVDGRIRGSINLAQLPPALLKAMGVDAAGLLRADTDFRFRLSDLTAATFHRARLNGTVTLSDFRVAVPADSLRADAGRAELKFGSSRSFVGHRGSVDSLLTVSVRVDTASVWLPDLNASLSDLKVGFGCKNDASLADTTAITPLGGVIELGRLRFASATDSARAMMRGLKANARISRYRGDKKLPQLAMGVEVNRIVYAQGLQRVTLGKSDITVDMHLKAKPQRPTIAMLSDSVAAARRSARGPEAADSTETIDFSLDKSTASLLRRLELNGELRSRSGRVFSPFFPLRMKMSDLDFHFTTDSLTLNSLKIAVGQSNFSAKGSVNNLRRALTSRRRKTPLKIDFDLHADTINVNELTQAAFRGSALAAHTDSAAMARMQASMNLNDDKALEQSVDSLSIEEIAAILVPTNINADLRFTADNIIYSNMLMHDFSGAILVNNGAVSLQNLRAFTDIGSVNLNALYYAPRRDDIDFAIGLKLNRFRIDRVIELMPALDSIMPILGGIGGIIDVGLGATASLDSAMNVKIPSIHAMMDLTGDSLVVLDQSTYKTMAKWLLFKNKHRNMIDHMSVELSVENSMLELYPFMFDFDRYRLGVMGRNDLDLNLNYHVSVLKSPLPFKFGINITGPADNMKIRLGKARYKENMAAEKVQLADSARVNLVNEMRSAFGRGLRVARIAPMRITRHERLDEPNAAADTLTSDQLHHFTDSLNSDVKSAGNFGN